MHVSILSATANGIVLSSSVESEDGHVTVCSDTTITFTCSDTGVFGIIWLSPPLLNGDTSPSLGSDIEIGVPLVVENVFIITLVARELVMNDVKGNYTSTLDVVIYGCARASSRKSLGAGLSDVLIEDPAMLQHQTAKSKTELKPNTVQQTTAGEEKPSSSQQERSEVTIHQLSQEPRFDSAKVPTITKQTETRTKEGKRRITPVMLTSQITSLDSTPRPFTSSTSSLSKTSDHPSATPGDKDSSEQKKLDGGSGGMAVQLLSPPAKPITFEPLSPRLPKTKSLAPPISPSTKTSHKRRLLDTDSGSEPLPRAKRQKKHRGLDATSPPPSKPGTPQKGSTGGSASAAHTKSAGSVVLLSVPIAQSTLTVLAGGRDWSWLGWG